MNPFFTEKRQALREAAAHEKLSKELSRLEADCLHDWEAATPADIVREAYTDPGDPPGTMGVDRRLPCHVPARRTKRWRRVCARCGKEEFTTQARTVATPVPVF